MSDVKQDGGPAFPRPYVTDEASAPDARYKQAQEGMSLRDYFAAHESLEDLDEVRMIVAEALAGPKPPGNWEQNPIEWIKWDALWRAAWKYIRADAMLKAREK